MIEFQRLLTAVILTMALVGCSGNTSLAPVTGTVTYLKQPLAEGEITFLPEGGRPSYGKITDGKITDVTNEDGPGVMVGKCKVTISSIEGGNDMYAKKKSRIPERYSDPTKSNLTATVPARGTEVNFDLTK